MNIIYKYRDQYVSIDRKRMNMVASSSKDRATLTSSFFDYACAKAKMTFN